MSIGITNAIGARIVQSLVPTIGLHSRISELNLTVLCIFLMSYLNISLFMMFEGTYYNWNKNFVPWGLSKNWFLVYGNCIFTSTLTTAFIPYAGPIIGILMKISGRKTQIPGVFNMERKYAVMLTTLFVAFTYGYEIPLLFIAVSLCFFVQFLMDKTLVTYWFEMIPIRSDSLIKLTIRIIKYAPVLMFVVTARCL
jgi:hypothetical protein